VIALMDQLHRLMPPPSGVEKPSRAQWNEVEEAIGTRLPSDFKEFVEHYGPGNVGTLLLIPSPLSTDEDTRLALFVERSLTLLRDARALELPMPFPIYPEPGGLLPFGETAEGDVFCWLADPGRDPDQWEVVALGRDTEEFARHDGPFIATLLALIRGELETPFMVAGPYDVSYVPIDELRRRQAAHMAEYRRRAEAAALADPHWEEAQEVQEAAERLVMAQAEAGSPMPVCMAVASSREEVRAILQQASIGSCWALEALYTWENGVDQSRWHILEPEGHDLEFGPGVAFPSILDAFARYRELHQAETWPVEWWPFMRYGGADMVYVCGEEPASRVLLVPDGQLKARRSWRTLVDFLGYMAECFAAGHWRWDKDLKRFIAERGWGLNDRG